MGSRHDAQPNVVAIIPARGGSKELPRKNIRMLAGKPLLAYAIEAAKSTSLIGRTIVTTDDPEIAEVALKWGAEVPFLRPAELADDETSTEATLQHAVLWLDQHENYSTDIVMFLTCTAVFRRHEWVNESIERLLNDPCLDSVCVVYKTHKNFWRKVDGKWERLAPDIAYASRQNREPLYREETPTACATRADLIRKGQRLGPSVDFIVTEDQRVSIDIHSEFDLWIAEMVMAAWPMERPL